eukprot:COSAG03_NODE_1372_length_4223_cov_2.796314_2_plen_145_part_00
MSAAGPVDICTTLKRTRPGLARPTFSPTHTGMGRLSFTLLISSCAASSNVTKRPSAVTVPSYTTVGSGGCFQHRGSSCSSWSGNGPSSDHRKAVGSRRILIPPSGQITRSTCRSTSRKARDSTRVTVVAGQTWFRRSTVTSQTV